MLPSDALAVEVDELGITAGLQDRVAQVWRGIVEVDVTADACNETEGRRHGRYRRLVPPADLPLYLAWRAESAEPSGTAHRGLLDRFRRGDRPVVVAMAELAEAAAAAATAIEAGDTVAFGAQIDRSFDLRRSVAELDSSHVEMVEIARRAGASANYAGSGGAIVGLYDDREHLAAIVEALGMIGAHAESVIVAPPR